MEYRRYLRWLSGILGTLMLLNAISLAVFYFKPEIYYFRPWEYLPRVAYKFSIFEPVWDREETSDHTRSNFFYYQDPHHTYVSVDRDGFRSRFLNADSYDILVAGDSAVFGSGLSDDETLPWIMAELLGEPVFNGGGSALFNTLSRPDVRDVELVLDVRAERAIRGEVFNNYNHKAGNPYRPQMRKEGTLIRLPLIISEDRYLFTSILIRTVSRMMNDIVVLLSGGEKPYLYTWHRFTPFDLDQAVKSIIDRSDRIRALGKRYIFVGIPAKQNLYADGIEEFTKRYLWVLTDRLQEAGVETINLAEAFHENKDLGLYPRYDTHWNTVGTKIAAREIVEYLSAGDKQ
jgi:hypothetical protein